MTQLLAFLERKRHYNTGRGKKCSDSENSSPGSRAKVGSKAGKVAKPVWEGVRQPDSQSVAQNKLTWNTKNTEKENQ